MEKIEIKSSSIHGKGIFAKDKIKKGETIFHVRGATIKYPFVPDWRIGQDWLNIGPNTWKIAYRNNPWPYINHSCEPNAGLFGKTKVVAMHPIDIGSEINIDYSCTEGSTSKWKMKCNCRKKQCRKIIRSIQFLPKKLFIKYKKFIPLFLQKEYLAQKVYEDKMNNGKNALFAKEKIKKGEIVFKVKGPIIHYPKPPKSEIGFRWLGIEKNTWLIPKRDNPWYVMCHSCEPNVGLQNRTNVVAMRTIFPHQEITIDDSITEADLNWKVTCSCHSKNCRKEIRSIQYLPQKLYKKYQPFIPKFFQNTYKKGI